MLFLLLESTPSCVHLLKGKMFVSFKNVLFNLGDYKSLLHLSGNKLTHGRYDYFCWQKKALNSFVSHFPKIVKNCRSDRESHFFVKKIIEMMKTSLRFGIEYETVEEHLPITTNNVNSSSVTTPSPSATIGVPRLFVRDILPGSIAQNGGEITDGFFL